MAQTTDTQLRTDWIIIDLTRAHWPGALPYRTEGSRRGYPTREVAEGRVRRIQAHYAAKYGRSPGDLRIRERVAS